MLNGTQTPEKYWRYALWLAFFTIFYNLAEGLVSIYFGIEDEALTLFGFGIDLFIEVMSGVGILAMVTASGATRRPTARSSSALPCV